MADFVDHRTPDLLHDFGLSLANRADGSPVDGDPVWQDAAVAGSPAGQRDALVEAEQAARARAVLDEDGHVFHQVSEFRRQRVERGADHLLERLRIDGDHPTIVCQSPVLTGARTLVRVPVPVPAVPVPARPVPASTVPASTVPASTVPAAGGPAGGLFRPTPADIAAARGQTIPDLVAPGLRVLFAGINPSLYSAATGHHFARPGNRFWPALHRSGFTSRQLQPEEQPLLLDLGLGITNVVARATARADELDASELRAGARVLATLAESLGVSWLAILGVTAYRTAFGRPQAVVGPQSARLGGARLWILPNPSGLNAHWSAGGLAEEFARLRAAADG
jgi:TDG/mug DNA glycosylase family protein